MGTLTLFWLQQNLKQGRIIVICALVLLLVVLNGIVFTGRFELDIWEWQRNEREFEIAFQSAEENPGTLAAARFNLLLPPSSLSFMAENRVGMLPLVRDVSAHLAGLPARVAGGGWISFGFEDIDLTFLVAVVFTFFAVVLTYDALCGERQKGTLRLILSNCIPRVRIITSKILAAIITLCLPLLFGLVVNAVLVVFLGIVPVTGENVLVFMTFLLLSVLLLWFFVSLGVLISSITRSPTTSLVILLLVWVLIVQVLPGSAKLIGKAVLPVATQDEFRESFNSFADQMIRDATRAGGRTWSPQLARADDFRGERIWNHHREIMLRRQQGLIDEQLRRIYEQAELIGGLSRISPISIFRLAVSRITGTDIKEVSDFHERINKYRLALFTTMRESDSRDKNSPHLLYMNGGDYLSSEPFGGGVPRFQWKPSDFVSKIYDSLQDILILFSLALCTTMVGILAFGRYDVR